MKIKIKSGHSDAAAAPLDADVESRNCRVLLCHLVLLYSVGAKLDDHANGSGRSCDGDDPAVSDY